MQNFTWFAVGFSCLLVAAALCLVLLRLNRALAALEETLLVADEAMREVVPEVRDGLGNVNDITAGVNVALRSASVGATRLAGTAAGSSRVAQATLYGVRVGARSLWRNLAGPQGPAGGQSDGR